MTETKSNGFHKIYTVLYLDNPDKVFYSDLDDKIRENLQLHGLKVIKTTIDEINFEITTDNIKLFINNEYTIIDAFLSYGYMSQFHYEAYLFIMKTFETMNVTCLHTAENEKTLMNKYLQALSFSKGKIPIPNTFKGYSVESFKNIANRNFTNKYSMIKKLEEYGGDGVKRCETKELIISLAAKLFWKNEYCIFQDYINDSEGKSVRVLCIDNKAIAVAEYVDKSNNYISNCSYGDFFELRDLKDHPKYNEYIELGEKAVRSIGNLTLGGVDILDSKEHGLVVLEINGFPDLFDIAHTTKKDVFSMLAEAFKEKICRNK